MNTFKLMPEIQKVIDLADAYKINATEVSKNSTLHYTAARNCFLGKENIPVKTYIRFHAAVLKCVEVRRKKIEAYNKAGSNGNN